MQFILASAAELHAAAHHRVVTGIPDGIGILAPDVLRILVVQIGSHVNRSCQRIVIRLEVLHRQRLLRPRVRLGALSDMGLLVFVFLDPEEHRAGDGAVALILLQIIPAIIARRCTDH